MMKPPYQDWKEWRKLSLRKMIDSPVNQFPQFEMKG